MICTICDGQHEPALHSARVAVRKYLRRRVLLAIRPVKDGPRGNKVFSSIETIGRVPGVAAAEETNVTHKTARTHR